MNDKNERDEWKNDRGEWMNDKSERNEWMNEWQEWKE